MLLTMIDRHPDFKICIVYLLILSGSYDMMEYHFISASHWLHCAASSSKMSVSLISYFPFGFYF